MSVLFATAEHLALVLPILAAALAAGVPLGYLAAGRWGPVVSLLGPVVAPGAVGATLLLLVAFGGLPVGLSVVLFALVFAAVGPVAHGTVRGLRAIPPELLDAALALGLPNAAIRRRVTLPLALPAILGGLALSAALVVVLVTAGGLLGLGGYGAALREGGGPGGAALRGGVPTLVLAALASGLVLAVRRRLRAVRRRTRPQAR